jgi:Protein of unknown function (DUF4242)
MNERCSPPNRGLATGYSKGRHLRARTASRSSRKSNGVLRQLGPDIQWLESYVADDKTFCVYLAGDENIIHKHAEISGFPATKIRGAQDNRSDDRTVGLNE